MLLFQCMLHSRRFVNTRREKSQRLYFDTLSFPKFSIYHELLCHAVKLDAITDPWTRLDYHKAIISASAQFVREYIQDCKDTTSFAICMTLSTIARVVWTQSRQLALNIIEHSELAAKHLDIGDQVISIRPQSLFTEAYEKTKLEL